MISRLRSFWFGLTLPFRAAALILDHPVLLVWSLLPVGITLSLYFTLISWLNGLIHGWLNSHFVAWGWSTHGIAAFVILVISKILLLLVGVMTFSLVASVAASPFNDFLAESSERWASPPLPEVKNRSVGRKLELIGIDALKSIAATIAALAALMLSWVPMLNAVAFLVAFLLIAFQYISYPQTRRGQGVRHGLRFLWRHLFACGGFGATLSLLFAIPLVSSLAVPLAVVGGTLLVARAQNEITPALPPLL